MFSSLMNEYSEIFVDWTNRMRKELSIIGGLSNKHLLRWKFFKLLEEVIFFDSFYSQTKKDINQIMSNFNRYCDNIDLIKPENYILETEKKEKNTLNMININEFLDRYQNQEVDSLILQMIPESKEAIDTFKSVINKLKGYPDLFAENFSRSQTTLLIKSKNLLKRVVSEVNSSPPPLSQEIYPLIQEVSLFISLINQTSPGEIPSIFDIEKSSNRPLLDTFRKYYQGKNRLNLLGSSSGKLSDPRKVPKNKTLRNQHQSLIKQLEETNILLKEYAKIASIQSLMLQNLNMMDHTFPVFIPRLAEIIEENTTITEHALLNIIQRHPEIGRYDKFSQVLMFSEPKSLNILFKQILPHYGERPFEELLTLLRNNQRINNHENNSLIKFQYKQLEFQLRTKMKLLEPVGDLELIQMALIAKIINQNEKMILEKFIKTRNDFNQKKIKEFKPKTMIEVAEVLRKLKR